MNIMYVGNDLSKKKSAIQNFDDDILLLHDKWDDFNYKTRFPVYCRMNGSIIEMDAIKVLFEDQQVSYRHLDDLVEKGWNGAFPITGINYISTPESLTFYEQIDGHLGLKTAIEVARDLRDASYMTRIAEHDESLRLIETSGFKNSLQREHGSIKAFLDGWRFFTRQGISIGDLTFNFCSVSNMIQKLQLNFASKNLLPHDINILIGPNGSGKSQLLIQIVKHWLELNPDEESEIRFEESPNVNQIVVISYSPFELFPLDSGSNIEERKDHGVYRYFGLRARETIYDAAGNSHTETRLSRNSPRRNAAFSLIDCIDDDRRYGGIKDWSNKVETLKNVLRTAIDFDEVAIGVQDYEDSCTFFEDKDWLAHGDPKALLDLTRPRGEGDPDAYIIIRLTTLSGLKTAALRDHLHTHSGIIFLKNDSPVELSSGQRLFSYIVANILGAMRRNSLILIDEPELFLHPTLEIAFIGMLKTILSNYDSKALLATHSLVTVRELPRSCVHVFERSGDNIVVKHPPFETFGGDVQRISSYVFGDKSITKPFEEWLIEKFEEFGTAEALIQALGKNINEEMIIQINAMAEGKW